MSNPANEKSKVVLPAGYQPMTSGSKRLEVPEREGYHRRWFRGDAGRIAKAQRAGYTFVDPSEVDVNNFDLGGDAKGSGNTDLGTRVSVVSGDGTDEAGQPHRLYLMEIPIELYEHGRNILQERNDAIADAIKGGMTGAGQNGETAGDKSKRYVNQQSDGLFNRK